ncbi:basigin [Onychostruthus taczanowskii]|uniref:basigin n=1 Tax=Onychostruthus taczanowskii TaxID=356909 RepID=UPI001B80565F|nr:basigin [Onychostruthus taczanowskii]
MAAGAAGTRALLALLVLCSMAAGAAGTSPEITTGVSESSGKVILSCNISAPHLTITGHKWIHKEKVLEEDSNSGALTSYTIEGKIEEHSGIYECVFEANPQIRGEVNISVPPQVTAYKKSEHGNEGDTGVLTCKNPSFPAVTTWTWHKSGHGRLDNASGRYIIKSGGNKTELRILKLDIEQDTGDYFCNAANPLGTGNATVSLRVRSRLAALWPFLGIVAEVLVLVTIIFIYEKRRKPDEVPDDDDGGSAPLKSNATNHKDKNVRQRNAN